MSNILTVQFLCIICSQYNSQTVYGVWVIFSFCFYNQPPPSQCAGGTHPTGMHSCSLIETNTFLAPACHALIRCVDLCYVFSRSGIPGGPCRNASEPVPVVHHGINQVVLRDGLRKPGGTGSDPGATYSGPARKLTTTTTDTVKKSAVNQQDIAKNRPNGTDIAKTPETNTGSDKIARPVTKDAAATPNEPPTPPTAHSQGPDSHTSPPPPPPPQTKGVL